MHAGARQTRYDGKQVFVPEVDKLLPGDILLTFNAEAEASKDLKQSKAIRAATGGSFSHALICSVPPDVRRGHRDRRQHSLAWTVLRSSRGQRAPIALAGFRRGEDSRAVGAGRGRP